MALIFLREREVAEFGMSLFTGSLPVPPKKVNERVMEQMVDVSVPQMKQENVAPDGRVVGGRGGRWRD